MQLIESRARGLEVGRGEGKLKKFHLSAAASTSRMASRKQKDEREIEDAASMIFLGIRDNTSVGCYVGCKIKGRKEGSIDCVLICA